MQPRSKGVVEGKKTRGTVLYGESQEKEIKRRGGEKDISLR